MAFSFPSSPTLNQTHVSNNITWTYNGKGWSRESIGGGGASVTVSDTAPASPTDGAVWLASDTGELYVYAASNWVLANGMSLANLQLTGSNVGLPVGTTAERPSTPAVGMARYNTTIGAVEFYTNIGWVPYGNLAISTVGPTIYSGASGTSFTITGNGFIPGTVVKFINNTGTAYTAGTVVIESYSRLVATTPQNFDATQGPLDVRVETPGGLSVTSVDCISTGTVPVWSTAAGSLATITDVNRLLYTPLLVVAVDSDAGATVSYSLISGSVPAGLTLTSSGQLTGTPTQVVSTTTSTFTVRASDGVNSPSDRTFSITVNAPVITTLDFTGSLQTFTVPAGVTKLKIYSWGGGGSGGTAGGWSVGSPAGAGGYAEGILTVTPGSSIYALVGGGAAVNSGTSAYGGGGNTNDADNRYGGSGGGYSGIFSSTTISQANAILIAGGGGGGGSSRAGAGNVGGAGGGATGVDGTSAYDGKTAYAGKGGTQSAAGADASSDGPGYAGGQGALQGGHPRTGAYGGAGGGGYYGGSAGGYSESNTMAGGGGGSGYLHPTLIASGVLTAGSGVTPGNDTSTLRGTKGVGGAAGTAGTAGRIVIQY